MRGWGVAETGSAKPLGVSDIDPVVGLIEGTVEALRIDKGFE